MLEIDKLADIMNLLVEDCHRCPLEKICDGCPCSNVWRRFFETKVKEDGVEKWD